MELIDLVLADKMETEPTFSQVIGEAFVKIVKGFWPADYVALITDRWGDTLTLGDVYAFVQVHALLGSGEALLTCVEVGETPHLDKYVAENNNLLQDLPEPFEATFWGGKGDSDGIVKWSETIGADIVLGDGTKKNQMRIPPGSAPLEVGHTNGFTTLKHLGEATRVARWPYESSMITIIHGPNPPHWFSAISSGR